MTNEENAAIMTAAADLHDKAYAAGVADERELGERELAAAIASFNEERERAQREGERVIELQVKLAEAVAAERERCARVCEEFYSVENIAQKCAEAIRKGEKDSLTVQRPWVGLTDDELNLIYAEPQTHVGQYAKAIETKLREKNT
jgi:hypothetical protein